MFGQFIRSLIVPPAPDWEVSEAETWKLEMLGQLGASGGDCRAPVVMKYQNKSNNLELEIVRD